MSEDKLISIQAEIVRLKRCYESATGKPVCGEGSVIRMECQQMTTMRTQLDQQYKLLRRAVEIVREKADDYYSSSAPGAEGFYCAECHVLKTRGHRNKLTCGVAIAQALLSDLEAVVLAAHATGEENKSNYEHKEE